MGLSKNIPRKVSPCPQSEGLEKSENLLLDWSITIPAANSNAGNITLDFNSKLDLKHPGVHMAVKFGS